MAITFLISAVLGLVRDRLLAHYYGDSAELGLYFAADRIPSLIFNLLVVGAFSAAFIPIFTRYLKDSKSSNSAWHLASLVFSAVCVGFFLIGSLIYLLANPLAKALSSGMLPEKQLILMSSLMRLMLVAQLLLIISSFLTSILQSFKHFLLPALTPIAYNLGIILGITLLYRPCGIYAPVWGMIIGALLHLMLQVPLSFRLGFRPAFSFRFRDPQLREVGRLMGPRVLSLALSQIPLLVSTSLAFLISAPAVVVLEFARHLQGLPVSIFGLSMAQATLPTLSEKGVGDLRDFKETFLTSWNQMLFFITPLSVLLIVLRVPVVRLVFGAAKFSWGGTLATAYTVSFFSFSIFAQGSVYLFNRALYALDDAKATLRVSFYSVLLNLILSVFMVRFLGWGVWSLALASSISSLLSLVWLFFDLDKLVRHFSYGDFLPSQLKIGYASLFTALSLYLPMKLLDRLVFDTTKTMHLLILTAGVSFFGSLIYVFSAKLLKIRERESLGLIASWLRRPLSSLAAVPSVEQPA